MNNIEKYEESINKIIDKNNTIYFLVYDTQNNPRASLKYIYDSALVLHNNGYNIILLSENKEYAGVKSWLDEKYDDLRVMSIKDGNIEIRIEDVIVVPEYYFNSLPQLANVHAIKVILVQQKEYIFETLPIGSRWNDYGFDKCITTTHSCKKYISELFPNTLVYLNPPYIGDNFKKSEKSLKPYIAISCRERYKCRKIISEFYLKYPQLRWIGFRDMIQMSYDDFASTLKECMVSLWIDDDSTFGTFPLESMKCGVPIIGKIPTTEPDWLSENGMWTYDENKLVDILGTYVLSWIEGVELTNEIKEKMNTTVIPYSKEIFEQNTLSIFNSVISSRLETIKNAMEKAKLE